MIFSLINTIGITNLIVFYTLPMSLSAKKIILFGVIKAIVGF